MSSLRNTEFTLTGLELTKLIREFVQQRCDAAGLQSHDDWCSIRELWERNEITEEEFDRRLGGLALRDTLRSISACKKFIQIQAQVGTLRLQLGEELGDEETCALRDRLLKYVEEDHSCLELGVGEEESMLRSWQQHLMEDSPF